MSPTCHPTRKHDSHGLCSTCARRARERARAQVDPALHTNKAPEGYRLRGVSTLRELPGGEMQWVKTERAAQAVADVLEAFRESIALNPLPARKRAPAPRASAKDLLCVYPMGDLHFGMMSWAEETGADFNLQIARRNLTLATRQLVSLMPPAKRAWIVPVGDLVHADGYTGATTKGTRVDVDTRYPKMLRVTIDTLVVCVDEALLKHEEVRVTIVRGNHDDTTAVAIALALEHHYRDEPRVQVDSAAKDFHWYEFGNNLLGTTHSHKLKAQRMRAVMTVDKKEAWGRTTHRRFYCGHIHHESAEELDGVVVEYLRTLAPRDAWHNGQGYRASQGALGDVWHVTRGKIQRHEIGVEDLAA